MPDPVPEPWWVSLAVQIVLVVVTSLLGLVVWAGRKLLSAFLSHLKEMVVEARALRAALNAWALRQESQLDRALDASLDEHGETQKLVREQGDRIVRKIEER